MTAFDKLKVITSSMNDEFFEKMEKLFKADTYFNKTTNSIQIPLGSSTSKKTLTPKTQYEDEIIFPGFCWEYDLSISHYSENKDERFKSLSRHYFEFESLSKKDLKKQTVFNEQLKYIKSLKDEIDYEFAIIINNVTNKTNKGIIEILERRFIKAFQNKFSDLLTYKEFIPTNSAPYDRLLFNLNLKELTVLMGVLIEAGFIKDFKLKGNKSLKFFQEYFYFINQKNESNPSQAIGLDKKISDLFSQHRNGAFTNIIDDMQKKMNEAFKRLKE